jgi:glutamate carboxypeptidase
MKGGLLLGLAALDALAAGERRFAAVDLISVPDEESRPQGAFDALERASGADSCLVLECSRENGDLVYERKAQANLRLTAHGRGAHAGTHPERGCNALIAMCREALRVDGLTDQRPGLTITLATMRGGTHFAVVPELVEADVDLRAWADTDIAWALEQVRSTDAHEGVYFDFQGLSRWPSMPATPASLFLLGVAENLGRQLGTPVGRRRTGGSSDGCWTASVGVPTLDGLGPIGGHDHSPEEYIDLDSWPARCGLLAGVITAAGDACGRSGQSTSTADEGDHA